MVDLRKLAEGAWKIGVLRSAAHPRHLQWRAIDHNTGDCVVMTVIRGELAGYSYMEWGMPESVGTKVWHVARIEPRQEKAKGGTKALVKRLSEVADLRNVWLTTEVKPRVPEREAVIVALLVTHGQFEVPDPDYPTMLVRRPRSV